MTTKEVSFDLPRLKLERIQITLIGRTPLIVHNWSEKAIREMLDKQMKKAKPAKEAKDPEADFMASLYHMEGGGYGFPTVGIKACAVTACTSVADITKVQARQAFQVIGELAKVKTVFNGAMMRKDLVRIEGSEPEMREDMVRVGMGTADIRYRAQFWPWRVTVTVEHNANVLSAEQIMNLFNTAGFGVGIGEWRSEKDGTYGAFHVATAADMKEPLKKAA